MAANGHSAHATPKKPKDFRISFPIIWAGQHSYQLSKLRVANREVFALTRRQKRNGKTLPREYDQPVVAVHRDYGFTAAFLLINVVFAFLYFLKIEVH